MGNIGRMKEADSQRSWENEIRKNYRELTELLITKKMTITTIAVSI